MASHCQPLYRHINQCVHAQRKELSIPAIPEANRLLVAFETYHTAVLKGGSSPLVDELRKEIHRGLEQLALTQQVVRMIASAGLSPWTFRRINEIRRDLEEVA